MQPRAQLLTGAAAFILITLSRLHAELREGLCGATRWTSVTLQVLAQEPPFATSPQLARVLLGQAIDIDPRNMLARCGFFVRALGQRLDDRTNLRALAEVMDAERRNTLDGGPDSTTTVKPGFEALEIRILHTAASAWLNVRLLCGSNDEQARDAWLHARDACQMLIMRCSDETRAAREPKLREFIDDIRPAAGFLWLGMAAVKPANAPTELQKSCETLAKTWTSTDDLSIRARYIRICLVRTQAASQPRHVDDTSGDGCPAGSSRRATLRATATDQAGARPPANLRHSQGAHLR